MAHEARQLRQQEETAITTARTAQNYANQLRQTLQQAATAATTTAASDEIAHAALERETLLQAHVAELQQQRADSTTRLQQDYAQLQQKHDTHSAHLEDKLKAATTANRQRALEVQQLQNQLAAAEQTTHTLTADAHHTKAQAAQIIIKLETNLEQQRTSVAWHENKAAELHHDKEEYLQERDRAQRAFDHQLATAIHDEQEAAQRAHHESQQLRDHVDQEAAQLILADARRQELATQEHMAEQQLLAEQHREETRTYVAQQRAHLRYYEAAQDQA